MQAVGFCDAWLGLEHRSGASDACGRSKVADEVTPADPESAVPGPPLLASGVAGRDAGRIAKRSAGRPTCAGVAQ